MRIGIDRLAAAARALNAGGGRPDAPFSLAFLTDRRRIPDPAAVARFLPRGAAIILRDYDDPTRARLASALAGIAAARGLLLIVGGDIGLAERSGADGIHLRADQLADPPEIPAGLIVSAACHSAAELARAAAIGAAVALLSPAFATPSHPNAEPLGPEAFGRLAAASQIPVLALGGVTAANAWALAGKNVVGIAAIGPFERRVVNSE